MQAMGLGGRERRVRRDPLKLHFFYLLSTRKPVDNDFFALTAGPQSIDARVAQAAD